MFNDNPGCSLCSWSIDVWNLLVNLSATGQNNLMFILQIPNEICGLYIITTLIIVLFHSYTMLASLQDCDHRYMHTLQHNKDLLLQALPLKYTLKQRDQ